MAAKKDTKTESTKTEVQYPIALKHADGRQRKAYGPGDVVAAEFDGFIATGEKIVDDNPAAGPKVAG